MKKALVLGGSGFIGSALIQRLKRLDFDITAVDRYWPTKLAGVTCVTGDVFDTSLLNDVMPNQDVIFHLVSTTVPATSNKSPVFDCETNVVGTLRILDAMVANRVKKIIYASSGGTVYGIPDVVPITEDAPSLPISAYGIGKMANEKYLNLYAYLHGIKATVLRISNPFGPGQDPDKGQGVIAAFIKRALCNEEIEVWGDGFIVRDFIYIDDLIDAFVLASKWDEPFSVFNIGQGEGQSLRNILSVIEKELKQGIHVVFKPSRACDVPKIILNIDKAKSTLTWQPTHTFEAGIKKHIAYMKLT